MARNARTEWVLIRGIVSETFHWANFPSLLAGRFPEDAISSADILGNGKFHGRATPLSVRANVAALRAQTPGAGKKVLVGFSLGAMLALEWAQTHPDEVGGVVLINASLNNSPPHHRLLPGALRELLKAAEEKDLTRREERILRLTTGLAEDRIRSIAPVWAERAALYPMRIKNFMLQILLAAQISQREGPPPVPVLILNSGKDRVVSPRCSALIADRWSLPLAVHPTAGHDLTLEDPDWVLGRIAEWIAA